MAIDCDTDNDLREEVAFWRREAAAMLWFATTEFRAAKSDDDRAAATTKITPILAAFASADAKDWFDECEVCGAPIKPGDDYLPGGEDSGPHCKAHLYGQLAGPAHGTPEDVACEIAAAKAILENWDS